MKIISGPMSGTAFDFNEHDVFIFGRASDCHCCLPDDPCISRHHFLLEVNPPEIRLKDLGSLNGTYLNNMKFGGREKNEQQEEAAKRASYCDVNDGDLIKVGDSMIRVATEAVNDSQAPSSCIKCGKPIGVKEREALAYIGGTFLCHECRNKLVAPLPSIKEDSKRGKANVLDDLLLAIFGAEQSSPNIPGYQFLKELGKGGFGKVYLVKRNRDDKELALKVMLSGKKNVNDKDVQRFQREMKICMNLRHKNIVTLEEQGTSNGLFYFTMEYCPGGNMGRLIDKREGPIEVDEAMPMMLQILDGLVYAHEKSIVHRDLKPENILLDNSQKVAKISDFGLSKNFEQAGLSGFTAAGEYAGTPNYMPKEQLLDYKHIKPTSDIFSIGATFYHMLTGDFVYDFVHGSDPLVAILEGKVIPIKKRRIIPKKLADVIDKSISPEANDRYQTAAEMKKDLQKAMK
ncbi:MAG: serine/threonine-protein kinase [Dehalococcoidia bacterium]|nr:serine/threonine-protein kinase [Dehalococcoidia bacterium]